jgi:uncharacterized protein
MITGEAKYADLMERTLYNGFLAGLSLDGQRYIYANPLQVRECHMTRGDDHDYQRVEWFYCACCPPNVMRITMVPMRPVAKPIEIVTLGEPKMTASLTC